jgi:hypothetical protein
VALLKNLGFEIHPKQTSKCHKIKIHPKQKLKKKSGDQTGNSFKTILRL